MGDLTKNTENNILDAAKDVFIHKGYDGASMQDIASKAGINKSLLHYYYRTKEKLFQLVFGFAFKQFVPKVNKIMLSDDPIFDKISFFVNTYIDLISKNPHIPAFIIREINRNPEVVTKLLSNITSFKKEESLNKLDQQIRNEAKEGTIRYVSPQHLITNMIGMSIFPFIARPILRAVLFDSNDKAYKAFLEERKKEVSEFIIHSMRVK